MASEKFCLKWNDFEYNIGIAFRELREEKDFFDVTLACEDSQVQAHKVILSSCSPFFRNILRRNPHQHPLLYLKGVKYKELLSVLNFMYQGEVNVAQEDLNSFLAVAEDLHVKGLTQNNSGSATDHAPKQHAPSPKTSRPAPPGPAKRDPVPPPKRPRPAPSQTYHHQDDGDIQEVQPIVKSEPVAAAVEPLQQQYAPQQQGGGTAALEDYGYDDGSGMIDPNKRNDQEHSAHKKPDRCELLQYIEKGVGSYSCTVCGKIFDDKTTKQHLNDHVESWHMPGIYQYPCEICSVVLDTRTKLSNHKRTHIKK
jgi:hypothetical protein